MPEPDPDGAVRHTWKGGENPTTTPSKLASSPPPLDILLPPRWLLRATKSEPTYRASRLFFLLSSRHFSLSPSTFSVLLPDSVSPRSCVSLRHGSWKCQRHRAPDRDRAHSSRRGVAGDRGRGRGRVSRFPYVSEGLAMLWFDMVGQP